MSAAFALDFARSKKPSIVRYISGVYMGYAQRGLKKIAKDLKIDVENLEVGEFVVFMNTKRTAFKMLAPNNVLVYYRHPKEHPIDHRIISYIPKMFDGKELHMDQALREVIQKDFLKRLR